ncbi:MAG: tandem-95 repeat protein [Ardenticatenaceae bacterium]|nr:tandem-95 repeat protein [Ardenticatenaceae bacterium]MCB9443878.1 tandem-95 repeat protein [Ardenticatenaceae bacterium]
MNLHFLNRNRKIIPGISVFLTAIILFVYLGMVVAAPGDLDTTFDSDGIVYTQAGDTTAADTAHGVAIQSDDKVVAVGEIDGDFGVIRYCADGSLDNGSNCGAAGFGTGGVVTTAVSTNIDTAEAIAIDSNGRILVAGYSTDSPVTGGTPNAFVVVRYNSNGSLDTGFGSSGIFSDSLGATLSSEAWDLALDANGKIVVAGTVDDDFAIARLTTTGALDTTFDGDGYNTTDIAANGRADAAHSVIIQASGKIVLGGTAEDAAGDHQDFALARYNSNGALDGTFGAGGVVSQDVSRNASLKINDLAYALGEQSDGKLILAGFVETGDVTNAEDIGLVRFTAEGALDTTFGTSGTVLLSHADGDFAYDMVVQTTNKIVVASTNLSPSTNEDVQLVRFNSDGSLDTTFGTAGFVVTDIESTLAFPGSDVSQDEAYAVVYLNNKIVVAGMTDTPSNVGDKGFAAVRYEASNNPPTLTNITKSGDEDTTISFAASDFTSHFSDVDADDLKNVKIFSLPANGTLKLGAANVAVNDVIQAADLGTLTFVPTANWSGSTSFNWNASDGETYALANAAVNIAVTAVNDPPTFTLITNPDQTVAEDAGLQTVTGFVTGSNPGPNESQTVTFDVSNDNTSLFATGGQPAISSGGTLTYTPADNRFGSATVTVQANDGAAVNNTSAPQTFTITITSVNDVPSFADGGNVTVNEDAGATTISAWATSISSGPFESDLLDFTVTTTDLSLFTAAPDISTINGNLTFTPKADVFGSTNITVTLTDGDKTTSPTAFTLTINSVNDAPSFTKGADQTVLEDSGAKTVTGWATNLSKGPANESSQTLHFNVSTDNDPLFASGPAIDSSGNLTFTPAANANGTATVTIELQDSGGVANGGVDKSAAQTFVITVTAVNDPPTFTPGSDVFVDEEFAAAGTTVAGWATNIGPGAANESSQNLTFDISTNNDAMFDVLPVIDLNTGDLTLTAKSSSGSTATVTVTLRDNGGTANGGSNQTGPETFVVTVTFVNDAPTFTAGTDQTVDEDAGAQTVAGWATNIYAGSPTETGQILTFNTNNDNTALFAAPPAIDAATGNLTYTPAANAHGSAMVTVTLSDDGGTANGGQDTSAPQTFTITVNPINDRPTVSTVDVRGLINQDVVFTAVDFANSFNDVDGDSLSQVRITSLPGNGVLKLNGTAVILNQQIPASNLNLLIFTPDADWNGTTSFTWTGSDGALFAANEATANINVALYTLYLPVIMR